MTSIDLVSINKLSCPKSIAWSICRHYTIQIIEENAFMLHCYTHKLTVISTETSCFFICPSFYTQKKCYSCTTLTHKSFGELVTQQEYHMERATIINKQSKGASILKRKPYAKRRRHFQAYAFDAFNQCIYRRNSFKWVPFYAKFIIHITNREKLYDVINID